MTFHEVRFPVDVSLASEGGPTRRTDIVSLASGREERNSPWAGSRRRYDAGYGVKSLAQLEAVIAFFEARRGRLYGFRWRDPFDWKSCSIAGAPAATDQAVETGDGAETDFPLTKTYASGGESWIRTISKPVAGTVLVAVDGTPLTADVDYTVDTETGWITFDTAPADGAAITAGYEFDTPVRFDADELRLSLAAFRAGEIPSIPLIEILVS